MGGNIQSLLSMNAKTAIPRMTKPNISHIVIHTSDKHWLQRLCLRIFW